MDDAADAPALSIQLPSLRVSNDIASTGSDLRRPASTEPPSVPPTPRTPTGRPPGFTPLLCVVDFHHARGPEVEMWFGNEPEHPDPAIRYDWPLLPFMALSDGAHASTEDFSYFTLLRPSAMEDDRAPPSPPTSLFGISCTRQMDASLLRNRPPDVTRSTVQKAVVIIADSPQYFGMLRERLSVVTKAWFDQHEFADVDILRRFQESLAEEKQRGALGGSSGKGPDDEDRDQYLGMSLRELVHEFRWQTLVLLKCCLLQPKMLFFGSRCERLCMMQFSLISLIPGLLSNLQDCASPELDNYAENLRQPTHLRPSERNSLLAYMGLPLQIFGRGSLFGPYTPLQQLDVLADFGTKSYVVGSTNSLLLQQRDRYSDILVNLDENTVSITSASLRNALQLSASDRRWIDFITQEVNDTWDDANPGRPKTMGYVGSEEFIRLQFEEYLLSLISSVKYHNYITQVNSLTGRPNVPPLPHIEGDPSIDFGVEFVDYWSRTENYKLWKANTDAHLFDFSEPKHPCAGGLSIDDVQRRIAQQVQDLHLDERFAQGREVLGRNLQAGRDKASNMLGKLYADMESLRESQRQRATEARIQQLDRNQGQSKKGENSEKAPANGNDTVASGAVLDRSEAQSKSQQTVQSVGVRASAYMSSWVSWAGEKRKAAGWGGGGRQSGTGSVMSNGSGNSSLAGLGIGNSTAGNSANWSLLGSSGGPRATRNTMSSTTSDGSFERGLNETTSTSDAQSPRMSISSVSSIRQSTTVVSPSGQSGDEALAFTIRNLNEELPRLHPVGSGESQESQDWQALEVQVQHRSDGPARELGQEEQTTKQSDLSLSFVPKVMLLP